MQRESFMQHTLFELRLRQYWPKKGHSTSGTFYFRYCAMIAVCSPLWVGLLLHFVVSLKEKTDVNLSVDVSVLASEVGLHFMSVGFIMGQKKIAYLFNALVAPTEFGKPLDFEKTIHKLNLYSKLFAAYCYIGTIIYICLKHAEIPRCRRTNKIKGLKELCGVMSPFWTPFDIDFNHFPNRELLLVCQLVNVCILIIGGAVIAFTTYEVASIIVLKIRHLKKLLKEVFDELKDEKRREQLEHCIKYHKHIIRLQELFDSRFRYPNGSYVIMVGIVIAGLANQYMKENNVGALIHLGGWTFSFFICCHAGQMIITESVEVGYAAYDSKWYQVPVELRKILLMVMVRSQQALELHGAPIGVMSHELFITLVKTSSSYFALLNQST